MHLEACRAQLEGRRRAPSRGCDRGGSSSGAVLTEPRMGLGVSARPGAAGPPGRPVVREDRDGPTGIGTVVSGDKKSNTPCVCFLAIPPIIKVTGVSISRQIGLSYPDM